MKSSRFILVSGPCGYMSIRPNNNPYLWEKYKDWLAVIKINKKVTNARVEYAKRWALKEGLKAPQGNITSK